MDGDMDNGHKIRACTALICTLLVSLASHPRKQHSTSTVKNRKLEHFHQKTFCFSISSFALEKETFDIHYIHYITILYRISSQTIMDWFQFYQRMMLSKIFVSIYWWITFQNDKIDVLLKCWIHGIIYVLLYVYYQ